MHLVEEAIRSGLRLSTVFFANRRASGRTSCCLSCPLIPRLLLLPDDVFASAVPSETPQGVAALVRVKSSKIEEVLRPSRRSW